VLVDRRLSAMPTTAFVDAVVTFFSAHKSQLANMRAAIVVRDDGGFGMGRMVGSKAEMVNQRIDIRPFRDYEAAVQWLTTD
jgi:hypothetical protein